MRISIITRRLSALALAVLLTFAAAASAAAVSAAAAPGTTQVSGLMVPDGQGACTGDPGAQIAYVVSGTLSGCWYGDTIVFEHSSAAGGFLASGTEQFQGCLGADRCGVFYTTFTFTAKYVGDVEVHGRCHHPIVGGSGGFAGASGVINMHDLPDGCSLYAGHVSLP